jgi:sucrose-6-phosphate hydrolase SacC (GH32 family)
LAVSVDGGKTFTKFDENPIVDWIEADNRDPKVIWHEATRRWIMALYLADDRYCLLSSSDAREWTRMQGITMKGDRECPDFFPLLDEAGKERWVFTGAKSLYCVGSFDGAKFAAETELQNFDHGRNSYAAQTWSNVPDGRCVQISWMAGGVYPEMPFNQQLSIPVELSLIGAGSAVALARWPVKELEALRHKSISIERQTISNGKPFAPKTDAMLLDVSFTVRKQEAKTLYMVIRGHTAFFDWSSNALSIESSGSNKIVGDRPHVPLPDEQSLNVRLLIDKTSIEVFINGGRISASFCFLPNGYIDPLVLHTYSGDQIIEDFELHELASIWETE